MRLDMVTNHLKAWRTRKSRRGISKAALARRMNVSRSYITKLEQGKAVPSLVLALQLARYFGCTVDNLFEIRAEIMTENLF
jgi:putative transcriptional regulator